MIFRKGILFMIEWLIVADQATAFKSRCVGSFCFISPPSGTNSLSWDSAQRWCSDNGTRLIEITNKDIQDAMSSFLDGIQSDSAYNYNGRNLFTNGKRETGSWSWLAGITAGYYLSIGGAYDASYAYGYLQLTSSASAITASRPTDTKSGYICQSETQCTSKTGVVLNYRCYTSYSNVWLSWYDARSRCLTNGGDLASFDFITQNQDLRVLNGSWLTPNYNYWLGLRQEWWTWQGSRADVKYSNWLSNHPNTYPNDPSDCLCLDPNNQWNWSECRCLETKPFICLSESRSSTFTTTSTSTTTTTYRPTSTTTATSTTTSISTSKLSPSTSTTTSSSPSNERISDIMSTISSQHPFENSLPPALYSSSIDAAGLGQHNPDESLNRDIAIGIGAGVGGGVVVVILIVVVAVILIRKRSQRSNPEKKEKTKNAKKLQTPDIIALQTTANQDENPYGTVIPLPEFGETNASENAPTDDKPQTIYANLEFLTGSILDDNSSLPEVATDPGGSRTPRTPPMSTIAEADVEVEQIDYNDEQYTTGTCATFL